VEGEAREDAAAPQQPEVSQQERPAKLAVWMQVHPPQPVVSAQASHLVNSQKAVSLPDR